MNIQTLTSKIADTTRHAFEDMGEKLEHGREAIVDTKDAGVASVSSAIDQGSSRLRTLASVVGAYASLRTLASAVDSAAPGRRALYLFGLQRRPSMLSRFAMGAGFIVAGAAVGAGVALLLAPNTGTEMRKELTRRFRSLKRDAAGVAHDVEEAAHHAVEAVEHSAQEAVNDVTGAVRGGASQSEGEKSEASQRSRGNSPKVSHRTPRS